MKEDLTPLGLQIMNHLECWRLTNIIGIGFVCDAKHKDFRTLEALAHLIEDIPNTAHHLLRHARVNIIRQFNETRSIVERFQLPSQIMWIEWDAMAS